MRDFNKEIVLDPISEARRYVDNAHETLRENGKLNTETGFDLANKIIDRCEVMMGK